MRTPLAPDRPRIPITRFGITIRIAVAIGILLGGNLGYAGVLSLAAAVIGAERLNRTPLGLAVFVGSTALMCGGVAVAVRLWCVKVERRPMRSTGWVRTRTSALRLLAGTGVSAGLVVIASASLPAADALPSGRDGGPSVAFTVVALLAQAFLLQGVPEELLFRGWLLTSLRDRPVRAIIVTTASFTVIHLISSGGQTSVADHLLYLALPFGIALLAVAMLLWARSLWAAAGVHGGFHVGNAIAEAAFPVLDGPSAWLTIGGVQAAVGGILIVAALRSGRTIDPIH